MLKTLKYSPAMDTEKRESNFHDRHPEAHTAPDAQGSGSLGSCPGKGMVKVWGLQGLLRLVHSAICCSEEENAGGRTGPGNRVRRTRKWCYFTQILTDLVTTDIHKAAISFLT